MFGDFFGIFERLKAQFNIYKIVDSNFSQLKKLTQASWLKNVTAYYSPMIMDYLQRSSRI